MCKVDMRPNKVEQRRVGRLLQGWCNGSMPNWTTAERVQYAIKEHNPFFKPTRGRLVNLSQFLDGPFPEAAFREQLSVHDGRGIRS